MKEDLDIIIESFEQVNYDGDLVCSSSYLYVNGERVDSDGDHLKAILEYLGHNVNINYD